MTKKDLVAVINTVVLKGGFKKSGAKWFLANTEIEKTISLQASRFSSKFYLNFGINIIGFDLNGLEYHVFEGFNTSIKNSSNIEIDVFDLDNELSDIERSIEISKILERLLIRLQEIDSKQGLVKYLLTKNNLNFVPLTTKAYLGLNE